MRIMKFCKQKKQNILDEYDNAYGEELSALTKNIETPHTTKHREAGD